MSAGCCAVLQDIETRRKAGEPLPGDEEAERQARRRLEAIRDDEAARSFVRAAALISGFADEEQPFVIGGLLPAGGTSILAGRPKAGKSTLALNLALAVARGKQFLGRHTQQGTVLYLALEGARSGWKSMVRRLGVSVGDDLYFFVGRAPGDADDWLQSAAEEYRPALIVIDTMQRLLRVQDGNDYATGSNATDAMIELARTSGAALLLLHHTRKSASADIVDEVIGSTAWAAAVDSVLVLRRGKAYRTLQSEQRFGENLPETVIEFDLATLSISAGDERQELDRRTVRNAMVEYLGARAKAVPGFAGATEPEITEAVQGRTQIKRLALREAIRAKEISVAGGAGKKGDPYRYKKGHTLIPDHAREQGAGDAESPKSRTECSFPGIEKMEDFGNRHLAPLGDAKDSRSHFPGYSPEQETLVAQSPQRRLESLDPQAKRSEKRGYASTLPASKQRDSCELPDRGDAATRLEP